MGDLPEQQSPRFVQGLAQPARLVPGLSGAQDAFVNCGYPPAFIATLNQEIALARQNGYQCALIVLNIQNLGMILHGFGSETAEAIMQMSLQKIRDIIGEHDHVYRIQHERFGVILKDTNQQDMEYMADRLRSHLRRCQDDPHYETLHVVSGVVSLLLPEQADNALSALSLAYLNAQELEGESPSDEQPNLRRDLSAYHRQEMSLANYLSKAIDEKRLLMAFQPIICSKSGDISYYEALLRIRSDDGRINSAGALIPIAERMGLIDVIDELTLEMVVDELKRDPDVVLSFNISNITTLSPRWMTHFSRIMNENPQLAPRLIVEITETAAQRNMHQTAFFVAEVQSFGCQVALDDFGSGYTSFRQLKALSVDIVKIDGVFIKDLVDNPDNRFFVKTLLEFTNGFGLKSVAEYVENGEIAKMLMELGVDFLQGYYFGKPESRRQWLKI